MHQIGAYLIRKNFFAASPLHKTHRSLQMKPANFPARKLARQIRAKGELLSSHQNALEQARAIRTKKDRSSKLRVR